MIPFVLLSNPPIYCLLVVDPGYMLSVVAILMHLDHRAHTPRFGTQEHTY